MNRQGAFEAAGKLLKGGLHCHTTRSDGDGTPEDVIRLHAENGYDFLALTDHRIYNFKNFAPETGITIIPGMEIDSTFERTNGFRCFHTVCLGPDDGTNGFVQDEHWERENVRDQFEYQKYLDEIHAKNNLTFYCHPEWSSTPARYFEHLQGDFAMEIWNSGGVIENMMDANAAYWDELLGQGKRIWGVAVDDGHAMHHHCKGWVMVNADNTVKDILQALKAGRFYASCGPVIDDFYVDRDVAVIRTQPDATVCFCADKHPCRIVQAADGEASISLGGDYEYIRASVLNTQGQRAWTNPIFLK